MISEKQTGLGSGLKLLFACLLLLLGGGTTFIIAAGPGGRDQNKIERLTFAVIGDSGTGEKPQFDIASQMVAARLKTPFDTVIMLGDNIYEGGKPQYFKPHFEDPYKDLLDAGVKFYAALGNHDAPYAAEHVKYPKFNMGGKRYYSFERNNGFVEFFALDTTEQDGASMSEAQLKWVKDALSSSKAYWKIVYFHHSIYSSGKMHSPYLKLRSQLEPLFVDYKVNVVFSGHFHVYERLKPQKGIQYYVAGSGGKLMKGNLNRNSAIFATGNDQVQIFLLSEIEGREMVVTAIDLSGKVVDRSRVSRESIVEAAK